MFSLLIVLFGSFRGMAVFSPNFGASVCIYKGFCDSTFLVLGEKSESEKRRGGLLNDRGLSSMLSMENR